MIKLAACKQSLIPDTTAITQMFLNQVGVAHKIQWLTTGPMTVKSEFHLRQRQETFLFSKWHLLSNETGGSFAVCKVSGACCLVLTAI